MKVTFLRLEDWIAVYVDGKLKAQGHSLEPWDMLEALGMKWEDRILPDDKDWTFTENLEDVYPFQR